MVVVEHVFPENGSQLSGRLDLIEVDPIVLQRSEKSLRPGIVQALPLPIHADPDAERLHQLTVVRIGEMSSLVAVDDLRRVPRQRSFQAHQHEGFVQGARQLEIHHIPAVPVQDHEQVHETFRHVDVGDVDAPDLVDPLDRHMTQQVGFQKLGMVSLAQVWLGKQRVDPHLLHDSPRPLPVDQNPIIQSQDRRDGPVPPGRLIRMDPVDPHPDLQFLVVQHLESPLPIDAASADPQQFTLPQNRQEGVVSFDQVMGFADVEGPAVPYLFFSSSRPHTSTGLPFAPIRRHVGALRPTPDPYPSALSGRYPMPGPEIQSSTGPASPG